MSIGLMGSDLLRSLSALGRFSCIGKNLALMELRYVIALLVSRFEVSFAPGEDGSRVEGEMKDQFAAAPGRLDVVFKPRS